MMASMSTTRNKTRKKRLKGRNILWLSCTYLLRRKKQLVKNRHRAESPNGPYIPVQNGTTRTTAYCRMQVAALLPYKSGGENPTKTKKTKGVHIVIVTIIAFAIRQCAA